MLHTSTLLHTSVVSGLLKGGARELLLVNSHDTIDSRDENKK